MMGYADPKFSGNQFRFAIGAFVLAIVLLIAVTCRGEAQQYGPLNCKQVTTGWPSQTTSKGRIQRGDTVWLWQKQLDSVATRCVLARATTPPPPVDTAPTPPPVDTTTPPPSPGGPFAAPDLAVITFNNSADDAKLSGPGGRFPGGHLSADATGGRNGTRALKVTVSSAFNNNYNPIGPTWPERARVFVRWYFRTIGTPGGNVKGYRFHNSANGNIGEVYGGSPCWSFDVEEALCFNVGLSYTSATANCPALADGNWHWIEVDYNRSAGANVETRLWCDGKAVVLPNGAAPHPWAPNPPTFPPLQFVGGDRATNTPTTLRIARVGGSLIGNVTIWETISQASGGVVLVDDLAVSTQRIGP